MLHSRVLRDLGEVARFGSIRAAGERLNVASSSINKHVLQAVLDGKADLGFAYNLPPTPNIEVMPRMNAQLGAVVSTAHPIAHMNMVPLSECLTHPWIFADKSMPIRQIVAEAFDASGRTQTPPSRPIPLRR